MRIIICGSRDFNDYPFLREKMDHLTGSLKKVVVLSGACPNGADKLGEQWAYDRWHSVERYLADWDKWGKSAGPRRNTEMLDALGEGGVVVAFWDGESRGTMDTLWKARKRGVKTRVYYFGKGKKWEEE